jgi:hypothetical protein
MLRATVQPPYAYELIMADEEVSNNSSSDAIIGKRDYPGICCQSSHEIPIVKRRSEMVSIDVL